MDLLRKLPEILQESEKKYNLLLSDAEKNEFVLNERIGGKIADTDFQNMLVNGDNLNYMIYLLKYNGMRGKIDLIYIDPPFFSRADYDIDIKIHSNKINKIHLIGHSAYKDTWEEGIRTYLEMLCIRLLLMKDLLAETGSIFVHLDWHVVHYVKVLMDEIFGMDNFINEIIWHYKSGGVSKRYFSRKHDTILFYSKSKSYYFLPQKEKSYNRGLKPYRFKGVEEFKDDAGWYTMVNMKDVWSIDMVGRTSSERTGYATQKPEALIERILTSCSKEGDLCADFFGGSGTFAAAADKMKRKWISCDIGKPACIKAHKRLSSQNAKYDYIKERKHESERVSFVELKKSRVSEEEYCVELNSYGYVRPAYDFADKKYGAIIEKIAKEDSLQLIDYWSIDTDYDNCIFSPSYSFYKSNHHIISRAVVKAKDKKRIAVKAVDVFGNDAFCIDD